MCIKFEAFDLLRDLRVMEAVWLCFNPLRVTDTINNDEFTVSFGVHVVLEGNDYRGVVSAC